MKFNCKFLIPFFFFISIGAVPEIPEKNLVESIKNYTEAAEESMNFLNSSVGVASKHRKQYESMLNSADELKVALQKAKFIIEKTNITRHFDEKDDNFSEMIQILTETCYSNIEIYESTLQLSKLNESDKNFSQTVKEVVSAKVSHLQNLTDAAEKQAVKAYQNMLQATENVSKKLTKLVHDNNSTRMNETYHLESMLDKQFAQETYDEENKCDFYFIFCWWRDTEGRKAARRNKEVLQKASEELKIFLTEIKGYVYWLSSEKTNLTKKYDLYQKRVAELKGQNVPLGPTVELFLKSNPEKMVNISVLLDTGLETINKLSLKYSIPYEENQSFKATQVNYSEYVQSEINQKFKSLFTLLSDKTKKKVLALLLFFEVGTENLENIIFYTQSESENFVRQMKKVHVLLSDGKHHFGNWADLVAQMDHISPKWYYNIYDLNKLKDKWHNHLESISMNLTESFSNNNVTKEIESSINSQAITTAEQILNTIKKFEEGTVDKIPYQNDKTTDLSNIAWNLVIFFKQILPDKNLLKMSIKQLNVVNFEKLFDITFVSHKPNSSVTSETISNLNNLPDGVIKNKSCALLIFFEVGLQLLNRFSSVFKSAIDQLIGEYKNVYIYLADQPPTQRGNPDFIKIEAQLMQLTLVWKNIIYKLGLQKHQYYNFISSINSMVMPVIEEQVDSTLDKVNYLLDEFQNGTIKSISYHFGTKSINVSSIAYDILAYAGKMFSL